MIKETKAVFLKKCYSNIWTSGIYLPPGFVLITVDRVFTVREIFHHDALCVKRTDCTFKNDWNTLIINLTFR